MVCTNRTVQKNLNDWWMYWLTSWNTLALRQHWTWKAPARSSPCSRALGPHTASPPAARCSLSWGSAADPAAGPGTVGVGCGPRCGARKSSMALRGTPCSSGTKAGAHCALFQARGTQASTWQTTKSLTRYQHMSPASDKPARQASLQTPAIWWRTSGIRCPSASQEST